ncbi:hypothetical protein HZB01_01890 [Candidatus Woesearchaeota archaeon]|nr:hypothetical protein [Candidatus Woesearchaeota archaeon]
MTVEHRNGDYKAGMLAFQGIVQGMGHYFVEQYAKAQPLEKTAAESFRKTCVNEIGASIFPVLEKQKNALSYAVAGLLQKRIETIDYTTGDSANLSASSLDDVLLENDSVQKVVATARDKQKVYTILTEAFNKSYTDLVQKKQGSERQAEVYHLAQYLNAIKIIVTNKYAITSPAEYVRSLKASSPGIERSPQSSGGSPEERFGLREYLREQHPPGGNRSSGTYALPTTSPQEPAPENGRAARVTSSHEKPRSSRKSSPTLGPAVGSTKPHSLDLETSGIKYFRIFMGEIAGTLTATGFPEQYRGVSNVLAKNLKGIIEGELNGDSHYDRKPQSHPESITYAVFDLLSLRLATLSPQGKSSPVPLEMVGSAMEKYPYQSKGGEGDINKILTDARVPPKMRDAVLQRMDGIERQMVHKAFNGAYETFIARQNDPVKYERVIALAAYLNKRGKEISIPTFYHSVSWGEWLIGQLPEWITNRFTNK